METGGNWPELPAPSTVAPVIEIRPLGNVEIFTTVDQAPKFETITDLLTTPLGDPKMRREILPPASPIPDIVKDIACVCVIVLSVVGELMVNPESVVSFLKLTGAELATLLTGSVATAMNVRVPSYNEETSITVDQVPTGLTSRLRLEMAGVELLSSLTLTTTVESVSANPETETAVALASETTNCELLGVMIATFTRVSLEMVACEEMALFP